MVSYPVTVFHDGLGRARPAQVNGCSFAELKAALSLGNRVVIVVGKDKSLVIAPEDGETKADKVSDFLK